VLAVVLALVPVVGPAAHAEVREPTAYAREGYLPQSVPARLRPWYQAPLASKTDGRLATTVVMKRTPDGAYHDHPVNQATYGLRNLQSWRATRDPFFLTRARTQADRLIAQHVDARGAWWFPYDFDFQLRDSDVVLTAPWYSGMAQGEVLSLMSQLTEALAPTDAAAAATYRQAAGGAFRSLSLGAEEQPWVSMVDAKGYLWFQEYPQEPKEESDFTYNGFGFAILGVWDYWRLTRTLEAARLFDGAVTTFVAYNAAIRNPGFASDYSLRNPWPHINYHVIHTDQLLQLQWLTGKPLLAQLSDRFFDDYPARLLHGSVVVLPGTRPVYRFSADGAVVATRTWTTTTRTTVATMARVRVKGRGIYYRLTSGPHVDWYAEERPGSVYLSGIYLQREYYPTRVASAPVGRRLELARYDEKGNVLATRSLVLTTRFGTRVDREAVVNGRVLVHVSAGSWAGWWVPRSAVTVV
jgi:hypothetical protein